MMRGKGTNYHISSELMKKIRYCQKHHQRFSTYAHEYEHDVGLYTILKEIGNGGAKIDNLSDGNRIKMIKSEKPFDKVLYSFDFNPGYEDSCLFRTHGEMDICGITSDGRPFYVETKKDGKIGIAINQLGKFRYVLANPSYIPIEDDRYRRFMEFFEICTELKVNPWDTQLLYHSAKENKIIDVTKEVPGFQAFWFAKVKQFNQFDEKIVRDYKKFASTKNHLLAN